MPLPKGELIDGRYRIVGNLGEGSMAEVYQVEHEQLGTTHALKVLKIDHESIRERMMREGQFQAKLRHPNVVNVTDVVRVGDDAGLVMEFIDGGNLNDLLRAHRLTEAQIDVLALGLLDGVEAAHKAGLIHRDLKPANILLARDGKQLTPKVTDFGLAKALNNTVGTLTKSGVMMGTPAYMAPEQIQDAKNVDQRADVFSIGAILYHMVAGRRPFDDASIANVLTAVLDGDYPPVTQFAPSLPAHRVRAIEAALAVRADDRPADVAALRALWTGVLPKPRDAAPVTTEGPFGRALLESLSAQALPPRPPRPPSISSVDTVLQPHAPRGPDAASLVPASLTPTSSLPVPDRPTRSRPPAPAPGVAAAPSAPAPDARSAPAVPTLAPSEPPPPRQQPAAAPLPEARSAPPMPAQRSAPPRPKRAAAPPPHADSNLAMVFGAVVVLLVLAIATVAGFGAGSAVLYWLRP